MAKDSFWEKYGDRRWQEKRLRIMERAKFCCEMCGSADNATQLHIHHGYYRSKADPWDYPDDTLWCLCEPCHDIAGDIKHDCQIELARINPAFLSPFFRFINSFRSHCSLFDEEHVADKRKVVSSADGYHFVAALLGFDIDLDLVEAALDSVSDEMEKRREARLRAWQKAGEK